MTKRHIINSLAITLFSSLTLAAQTTPEKPNIIFILTDDLGYGDLSHAGGKAKTPHSDRLANEGIRFTDAHTSSAVCTPTRYSILTGRYNWRSKKKSGVLSGVSAPLIPKTRVTIANFLKKQGYHTGIVGKWHLGIGWQKLPNGETKSPVRSLIDPKFKKSTKKVGWDIDYSKPAITPTNNGFDYFFGIAASLDMPPYVYIRNETATALADTEKAFGDPYRPGPASPNFEASQCLIHFAREAREYITKHAKKPEPFFLYLPLTSPHTPILPSVKWQGRSKLGSYGDFLMETDWVVGEVLAELQAQNIDNNTMIIFTSDNGCSPKANIPALAKLGHKNNADWRGHKADIYEGGHRVPFLVRWPAVIKPGSTSHSTICTTDFFATAADSIGANDQLTDSIAEDSFSFLADLKGTDKSKRPTTIHHSINGSFAIREGKWKLNLCPGSGGWSHPRPGKATTDLPILQLYNLETDPAEQTNLHAEHPEIVTRLINQLAKEIKNGRSTPGKPQTNEGPIPFSKEQLKAYPQLAQ